MKPIMIFVFSAPLKTFQRIWPLLVTVEIALSFDRLAFASIRAFYLWEHRHSLARRRSAALFRRPAIAKPVIQAFIFSGGAILSVS
jgi:hypothetical protein